VIIGQVCGDPVDLQQGYYRVVVNSLPQQVSDEVDVHGKQKKNRKTKQKKDTHSFFEPN